MSTNKKTRVAAMGLSVLGVVSAALMAANPAQAEPPGFPDVSGFAAANVRDYVQSVGRGSELVWFTTPFGYRCHMNARTVDCEGRQLPGYINGTNLPDTGCGQMVSNGGGPDRPAYFQPAEIYCRDFGDPVLSAGQKIEYKGVTCAVGADFTACTDNSAAPGPRGFVLRQDGNSLVF
ncbi:hypothetical protein [Mycobacteroides abscessus]|uniref:hypothetical protein n=1 Tax=Mycobacteroides abscessus TaxID=36809 RepID=UPI0011C3A46F|nr:hypothetical protein [Mycobacteroides abscessus]